MSGETNRQRRKKWRDMSAIEKVLYIVAFTIGFRWFWKLSEPSVEDPFS